MRIRTRSYRNDNLHYSKARATTFTGYKFTPNRLDHEPFYQSNIKRLLHLSPYDCKNEFSR